MIDLLIGSLEHDFNGWSGRCRACGLSHIELAARARRCNPFLGFLRTLWRRWCPNRYALQVHAHYSAVYYAPTWFARPAKWLDAIADRYFEWRRQRELDAYRRAISKLNRE